MNLDNALVKEKAPKTENTQYKYIEIRQVGHFRLLPGNLPLSWQEMLYISELADNPSVDMIPHDIDKTIDYLTDPAKRFLSKEECALVLGIYKDGLSLDEAVLQVHLETGKAITPEKAKQLLSKTLDKLRHPKCMRYLLLGVRKARNLENRRKKNSKGLIETANVLLYTKEYSDDTLCELLSVKEKIERQIEETYLTFHAENDSASGTRVDTLPIPKPVKKKLTGRGYVRVSDLIGKTEAEVRKNARLTYEESYKLKKALKETGVIVA